MLKRRCPNCLSKNVILFGKASNNKQRFKCLICNRTHIWKDRKSKDYREKHWFDLWVTEGFSVRQLKKISGHSERKIYRILEHWLSQKPPDLSQEFFKQAQYLLFDGTYFGKNGCLCLFIDIEHKKILCCSYVSHEGYATAHAMATYLKEQGVKPIAITLDGHKSVIAAILDVWPSIVIQRCLFHIQRQGLSWLRTYPRTKAGKELKEVLLSVMSLKTLKDKKMFLNDYLTWSQKHEQTIQLLPRNSVANKDLKRTRALVNNAMSNMFHYLNDSNIASTTNYLEGFYSQLKHHYRSHRGLTKNHQTSYLRWYCYLKNR